MSRPSQRLPLTLPEALATYQQAVEATAARRQARVAAARAVLDAANARIRQREQRGRIKIVVGRQIEDKTDIPAYRR